MNLKRIAGIAAGVLVGVTLLACGAGDPGDGTGEKKESVASGGPEAPSEEPKEDGPNIAQLGSKGLVFVDEKIDVAISKPAAYKPSEYAEKPKKGERAFVVTVEVINNRDQAINVDRISITASIGEENAEMDAIFDTEAGLKGAPSTALLPGKTARFKYGFVGPTTEKNPVVNINVQPWELGMTTGLFQGKL